MKEYIRINPADNVAVVLSSDGLKAGTVADIDGGVVLAGDIMRGHKFALTDIPAGAEVIKYGFPIGRATADIKAGEWVHSHNLATGLGDNLEYTYHPSYIAPASPGDAPTVDGFLRRDGRMGIRNELWIIPTVGCVNGQANAIARRVAQTFALDGIDDVRAFTHNYGCSQLGADHANTRTVLAAMACHPNAGGVLVLGLGCENNQISALREAMGDFDPERVRFLEAQKVGDEVEEGVRMCGELLERMRNDRRESLPLSKLCVGLKCGGSDGLSGITANPLVGMFSDWLVANGGSTVLTEVPEMFGAETLLMDRAIDRDVFDRTVKLINDFKAYFRSYGQPVYENPSPGNKEGGITTLEEKSLGCVQKGGSMPVVDVLSYGQPVTRQGLNLLQSPGNDLVAASALALSGCQIVLFTTGRGTPFGTFVPTLKIATNTMLFSHKSGWIDFNAGGLVEDDTPSAALNRLVDKVLDVACGERTRNELSESKGLAIFKNGVTL